MSSNDYLTRLTTGQDLSLPQVIGAPPAEGFDPDAITLHIASPSYQNISPSVSQEILSPARGSTERTVAVYRQHFVVHGPSCQSGIVCDRHQNLGPYVAHRAVGLPRLHVVRIPRNPVGFNLSALWARSLSEGSLVGIGDRVWVDGLGEVVLEQSIVPGLSPYWGFFSAKPVDGRPLVEMATELSNIRLTPEEYELRSSLQNAGRGSGVAGVQLEGSQGFEDGGGWVQWSLSLWRGIRARLSAIFLHRVVDPDVQAGACGSAGSVV